MEEDLMLDDFYEACTFLDKQTTSDGMGGMEVNYVEGAEFLCGVSKNSSLEAQIAEQQGVTGIYNITIPVDTALEYHDIFKRNSDGLILRLTSNPFQTPNVANVQYKHTTAEEWSLV